MKRCVYFLSLFFAGILSAAPATQQWAGFRGPDFNGAVATPLVTSPSGTMEVVWRTPAGPAYSGVVIADGKTITMYSDGTSDLLVALDSATGKEAWRYTLAPLYKG